MGKIKKIIVLIFALIFVSCDKLIDDDFIIMNNCSDEISVKVIVFTDKSYIFNVAANADTLFLTMGGIPRPKTSEMIKTAFKHIEIIKNGVSGKKNYINQGIWTYNKITEEHYKWYLIINTEDFE